jgi:stage II sporulation protein D
MMLRSTAAALATVAVLGVVASASPAPAPPPAPPTPAASFAISGRGWGHGVGMSQYGALGFAQHGYGYARILAHYYRGTTLARAPVARVRVLLVEGKRSLTVSTEAGFRVRDGSGKLHALPPGAYILGPRLKIAVGDAKPRPLPGPLVFSSQLTPLRLDGKPYRGTLEIQSEAGRLRAINGVGLEAYLYGVVPDEVPHYWPAEALKAQAVVARSYALAVRKPGAFDLYDDVRSQVYNGIDAEEQQTTAAVNATAGQVLVFAGRVATTFFFSTSGGRTADISDVWNAAPTPYLVSVPDPYDSISPHHSWGPYWFSAQKLAKALGVKGKLVDLRTTLNRSGRVAQVIAVGSGGETSVPGADVRQRLGLRSTWFSVGLLALDRPAKPVVHGGVLELTGRARGMPSGVTLERRAPGVTAAAWERVAAVSPAADGSFAVPVKPAATTEYRLASARVHSAAVLVAVAPFVRLLTPQTGDVLRGSVRPALPGASVAIQRQEGGIWRSVAKAVVETGGAFEARLALTPGTYRARLAPGNGFAAGVSAPLKVLPA